MPPLDLMSAEERSALRLRAAAATVMSLCLMALHVTGVLLVGAAIGLMTTRRRQGQEQSCAELGGRTAAAGAWSGAAGKGGCCEV